MALTRGDSRIQGACLDGRFMGRLGDEYVTGAAGPTAVSCRLSEGKYNRLGVAKMELTRGEAKYTTNAVVVTSLRVSGSNNNYLHTECKRGDKNHIQVDGAGAVSVRTFADGQGAAVAKKECVFVPTVATWSVDLAGENAGKCEPNDSSRPRVESVGPAIGIVVGGSNAGRPCRIADGVYRTDKVSVEVLGVGRRQGTLKMSGAAFSGCGGLTAVVGGPAVVSVFAPKPAETTAVAV
jgi:hypothetical protein